MELDEEGQGELMSDSDESLWAQIEQDAKAVAVEEVVETLALDQNLQVTKVSQMI